MAHNAAVHCDHWLWIDDKRYLLDTHTNSFQAEYDAMMATKYDLVLAQNGRSVAFSSDAKTWVVVHLDAGNEAFVAMHQPVKATAGDVFAKAPSTAAAAQDFFVAAARGDFDPRIGVGHDDRMRFKYELVGAVSYACSAPADRATRAALRQYALGAHDKKDFWDELTQSLANCARDIALNDKP